MLISLKEIDNDFDNVKCIDLDNYKGDVKAGYKRFISPGRSELQRQDLFILFLVVRYEDVYCITDKACFSIHNGRFRI
jgi:hypothetical protein